MRPTLQCLRRRAIHHVALLVVFAGALSMCFAGSVYAASLPSQGLAPNFVRTDLNHQKVELSHYRGKVVLLNFWASWCPPCLIEMPKFVEWQREYKGLQVIGVAMGDSPQAAAAAANKLKVNYPVVVGDARLGVAYHGVLGLPVTFLIDRKGVIRGRYQGDQIKRVKANLLQLLAKN